MYFGCDACSLTLLVSHRRTPTATACCTTLRLLVPAVELEQRRQQAKERIAKHLTKIFEDTKQAHVARQRAKDAIAGKMFATKGKEDV